MRERLPSFMRQISIPLSLEKAAGAYQVGGVASSFHRDLDGEAIVPDAIRQAIPDFMATRGADGIQGGPIRLHHDFWTRFLQRAVQSLRLPDEQQLAMVSAIALPLGRVTKIWVDSAGVTHWLGVLSEANPVARVIWDLLKEGLIHLGVSLGGKIFETQAGGRDALGRPCNLITKIRIDELSITDNPALRLTQGEDTGAYISALAKSVRQTLRVKPMSVEDFLRKAIAPTNDSGMVNASIFNSAPSETTKTGLSAEIGEPNLRPKGSVTVKIEGGDTVTGMGGTSEAPAHPKATDKEPPTDVWGMTVGQLASELSKCAVKMSKAAQMFPKADGQKREMLKCSMGSEDMNKMLTDGAYGLTTITPDPPDALLNFVRFLQHLSQFTQSLPYMDDFQAEGTMEAMGRDLTKALEAFQEGMPKDLMGKTFRPDGSPNIGKLDIVFPQQYVVS